MKQTLIRVQCLDQELHILNRPTIASGGFGEDLIEFTFCEKWVGFTKTAVFYQDIELPFFQPLEDDKCVIPWEVLTKDGDMYFGVFGENADGITRTSELLRYKVKRGAIMENLQPTDPTPELWAQVLAKMQAMAEAAEDLADSAQKLEARQSEFEAANTIEIDPGTKHWVKGGVDTGVLARATYVHFRWAEEKPTAGTKLLDHPAPYIGIYNGVAETPPTDYTAYQWLKYVGADVSVDVLRTMLEEHSNDWGAHQAAFALHNGDDYAHSGQLAPYNHSHYAADISDLAATVIGMGFGYIATGSYVGDGSGTVSLGMTLQREYISVNSDHYTPTYTEAVHATPRRIELPFVPHLLMIFKDGDTQPTRVFYTNCSHHVEGYASFRIEYWENQGLFELAGKTTSPYSTDEYSPIPHPVAYLEGAALCLCATILPDIEVVHWVDGSGRQKDYSASEYDIASEYILEPETETFNAPGVVYHYVAF